AGVPLRSRSRRTRLTRAAPGSSSRSRRMIPSTAAALRRSSEMAYEPVRRRIVELGVELEQLGLLDLTAGNISARVGDDEVAITPWGIPSAEPRPEAVVVCPRVAGPPREGPCRPSSELPLHRAVSAARPDVRAVVHTHSPFATTIAVLRRPIPAVHYVIA